MSNCTDAFGNELRPGDDVAYASHRGHSGVYMQRQKVARLTSSRVFLQRTPTTWDERTEFMTVPNRVVFLSRSEA